MEALLIGIGVAIGVLFERWRRTPSMAAPAPDTPGVERKKAEYSLSQNLSVLASYVRDISKNFGADLLRTAPIFYPAPTSDDRNAYATGIIRLAARRYGVEVRNLGFRFVKKGTGREAGSLRQEGDRFFLDVLEQFRDSDVALHAIIAHEMAHYALAKKSLRYPDGQRNEELTDALTALGGFGPLMLEACYSEFSVSDGRVHEYVAYGLGYLHPSAFAYLTLVQAELAAATQILAQSFTSPWMREPRMLWAELVKQRINGEAVVPLCLICGELLPRPDPGTLRMTTCKLCRYTQPFPMESPPSDSSRAV